MALKRHMKLVPSAASSVLPSSSLGVACAETVAMERDNPYEKDAVYVKDTILVAESIVQICAQGDLMAVQATLPSMLERLCILISPSNDVDATRNDRTGQSGGIASQEDAKAGACYDSTSAGMAANALLTQFVSINQPSQQSTQENLAVLLANALAHILNTMNSTDTSIKAMQMQSAIALTQLAATEPPPPPVTSFDQEQYSPYGHPPPSTMNRLASAPTSWCFVIVTSSALAALVSKLPQPSATAFDNTCDLDLCWKCVWSIGNLAGDSETAREALRGMQVLPRLITCISLGIQHATVCRDGNNNPHFRSLTSLVRYSVWGLTNFVREGGIPLREFFDFESEDNLNNNGQQHRRLTTFVFKQLLTSPEGLEPLPADDSKSSNAESTWYDVAAETCWLISFLPLRGSLEEPHFCDVEVKSNGQSVIISSLAWRLSSGTYAATQYFQQTCHLKRYPKDLHLCVIPTLRALKSIAYDLDRRFANMILLSTTNDKQPTNDSPTPTREVETAFATLIALGTLGAGSEATSIAIDAAETAGACLDDAGLPLPNPATNACRILIPALRNALISQMSPFMLRNESAWALWKAVDFPELDVEGTTLEDIKAVQRDILSEMLGTSQEAVGGMVDFLSQDNDNHAVLHLIDTMLRSLDSGSSFDGKNLSILFEEAGLVTELWKICDGNSDEATGEIAAGLLDDFYEGEEDKEVEYMATTATDSGEQFQFQAPPIAPGGFNFNTNMNAEDHVPYISMTMNAGDNVPSQQPPGRGRGRGQVIPAWTQKQHQR